MPNDRRLPPGQHRVDGFPRFGAHLHRPPPAVPVDPDGYVSVKHLSRIEVLTAAPRRLESPLLRSHPRAGVWEEERHGLLPGRVVRPVYRALIAPIRYLSARGSRPARPPGGGGPVSPS